MFDYKIMFYVLIFIAYTCFLFVTGFLVGLNSERKYNEKSTLIIDKYYGNQQMDEFAKGVNKHGKEKDLQKK